MQWQYCLFHDLGHGFNSWLWCFILLINSKGSWLILVDSWLVLAYPGGFLACPGLSWWIPGLSYWIPGTSSPPGSVYLQGFYQEFTRNPPGLGATRKRPSQWPWLVHHSWRNPPGMVGILRIPPGFLQEYVGECKELVTITYCIQKHS